MTLVNEVVESENLVPYQKIIQAIHATFIDGRPFALRDVAAESGVSISSVVRTLRTLKTIKMLTYTTKCFMGRHYRVGKTWPADVKEALTTFEFAKALGR